MSLTEDQIQRYARHILLPDVGGVGQEKLLASRVLVVGAGGLGSPLLLYLAAAGVGTLGVVDHDRVDLSNLQRQVIHATEHVGAAKVESAAETVRRINPDVRVIRHDERVTAKNVRALVEAYDLVADGTDNFATHYLMNDACFFARKPLVAAALGRYDGQLATYKAYLGGANPCYRCLYSAPPPPGMVPSCAEAGVLGAVAGVVGTLQATEVLKELLGIGESLSGKLLIYDALDVMFRKITLRPDSACALCSTKATITDLSVHAHAAE
jgi:molybdopterin-synthase adenylyltransferase